MKQIYLDSFDSIREAAEFEQAVLNCGKEFLPDFIIGVTEGREDLDDRYWAFMLGQLMQVRVTNTNS